MGRVEGKVALVTGAARGQGRAHAIRLAEEGADVIAVDFCGEMATAPYAMGTADDLAETVKAVEALDRRIVARQADVRDLAALEAAVAEGVAELGHLDVVVANAGICSFAPTWELTEQAWQDMLDVNLTGVWKTAKVTVPILLEQGHGGSVVLTSSIAGLIAFPNLGHYTAAKHGVTGLMRTLAVELAPHMIRVNSVHPTTVDTPMVNNPGMYSLFMGPDGAGASRAEAEVGLRALNGMPIPWVDPVDVSNVVLWLASEESRYVTGSTQVVDAGGTAPFRIPHAV
jgi:SDR family mycofactocin-dependent oxidoreductase